LAITLRHVFSFVFFEGDSAQPGAGVDAVAGGVLAHAGAQLPAATA
jgi:hypothetical protein